MDGECHLFLDDAAGHRGIEHGIHVGLFVEQGLIEINGLGLTAIEAHQAFVTTDIQEVEGGIMVINTYIKNKSLKVKKKTFQR